MKPIIRRCHLHTAFRKQGGGTLSRLHPRRLSTGPGSAQNYATVRPSAINIAGIIFFSGLSIGTAYLGSWQIQRYHWKVDLIENGKEKVAEDAETIPRFFQQDQLFEFSQQFAGRRITTTGEFDHSKEMQLGLRTAPMSFTGGPAQGLASNPQGYYIITPFRRSDGTVLLVNRGWVPRNQQSWSRPSGTFTLDAVISKPEKGSAFSPLNTPEASGVHNKGKLLWLEAAAMVRGAQLEKEMTADKLVFAEAAAPAVSPTSVRDTSPSGDGTGVGTSGSTEQRTWKNTVYPFPRQLDELQEQTGVPPLTHLVYAVTWFSLSAAGMFMTLLRFRGARTKSRGKGRGGV